MTAPTALRRGQQVLIQTDLPHGGASLRGRRGRVHRLGSVGSIYVCTCASSSDFHAATCPADMPLTRSEVDPAPRLDPRTRAGQATS